MDEVSKKIENLRKAVKEAGIVFHSPHSPTVVDSIRAPKEPAFEGPAFKPTDQHLGDYNALPHQKQMQADLKAVNYKPNKGLTLHEYSGHTGSYSKDKNAFVQDLPNSKGQPKSYFSKRNPELQPHERKSWGLDDRQMSISQREVAYHNMAHQFFGLGEHVPAITLHNDEKNGQWTVQDWHHDHEIGDGSKKMFQSLTKLHNDGHFPKIAVMDMVLGNTDRHMGNVIFKKDAHGVKFIDNGMSFTSTNKAPVPSFYTHEDYSHIFNGKITPEFKAWIKGLRPEKFSQLMDIHGVPKDSQELAMKRLEQAHTAVDKHDSHNGFFREIRNRIF